MCLASISCACRHHSCTTMRHTCAMGCAALHGTIGPGGGSWPNGRRAAFARARPNVQLVRARRPEADCRAPARALCCAFLGSWGAVCSHSPRRLRSTELGCVAELAAGPGSRLSAHGPLCARPRTAVPVVGGPAAPQVGARGGVRRVHGRVARRPPSPRKTVSTFRISLRTDRAHIRYGYRRIKRAP